VNRLVFGDRDDPSQVVSRLGEQLAQALQPEDVLPAVSNAAASALGVDFVAIDRLEEDGWVRVHERGLPEQPELSVPVTYASATIGRLVVGGRGALRAGEHGVLSEIARQAGVALHAAGLTDELQRSREQLVHAREEERRRLRRDLHDGLGPTLAAMQLQLRSAELLLTRRDGPGATALLEDVKAETQQAIADIRRLVYALRPPALDDLGLVGALSQQAARFTSSAAGDGVSRPLVVTIDAPRLERLPAAVEVAAYRIALEALTNVSRHAGAGRATVRLALNGSLELEVTDDGAGLAEDARPSVGLGSMRERAAELGGTCTIDRVPGGGTRVLARLPMREE
jgi:signal transduction histidine kinase